ncbi:MAG: class I SAM-dependent methyltransferase [Phycisphaerales bacterium JB041]
MSSLHQEQERRLIGASVRERSGAAKPRRTRQLEKVGRAIVGRALAKVVTGQITVVDQPAGRELRSHAESGPSVTVRIHDPAFYTAAAFGGSVGIAESYIEGQWTTDDLAGLIEAITANIAAMDSLEGPLAALLAPLGRAAYWLERNTRAGSRRNIVAHYDLGNEFFALFLDPTMSYSSAVFENGADTLEAAQIEKIDRACRKLDLKPTDHLLEIGTGWGAMAIHAASRYGCRVTTTTISDEQHRLAARRVREAGLESRVTLLKQDYRDLSGQFDKLVSIEMVEAVGAERYGDYFEVCSRCLKPDGAALIQAIVIRDQYFARAARRRDFLKKYIFPGSCLPSVGAMLRAVDARTDLRTWHLEDLAPHYATTLRLWREAFVGRLDEVRDQGFDERFIRMWEYYLAYCEGAYRARHVGVVQWLLTKPDCRIRTASGPAVETM